MIAIIGILATVVFSSLSSAREKASIAKTKASLGQLQTVVAAVQISSNNTVYDLTGDTNTSSSCDGITDLSVLSPASACVSDWRDAINVILLNYDLGDSEASVFYEDAWGSPYLLSEGEGVAPNPCSVDTITSVGKDRKLGGGDDITVVLTFAHC